MADAKFPDGVPKDEKSQETKENIVKTINTKTSALYSSSRLWDDGIILPQHTRKVLGQSIRIINQSYNIWSKQKPVQPVVRL